LAILKFLLFGDARPDAEEAERPRQQPQGEADVEVPAVGEIDQEADERLNEDDEGCECP
jgi:hypothetical protein